MYQKTMIIKNRSGIHARPSALVSGTAQKFKSDIIIAIKQDTKINAKSILEVLSGCLVYGTMITLKANGEDEVEAVETLSGIFQREEDI